MKEQENTEKEIEIKKEGRMKSSLRKIGDILFILLGLFLFLAMLAFFQTIQESNVSKEKKETVSLEKLQKEVDDLYKSEQPTTSEILDMYKELRDAEKTFVKKASTPEDKNKVRIEILSMKQDVLIIKDIGKNEKETFESYQDREKIVQ